MIAGAQSAVDRTAQVIEREAAPVLESQLSDTDPGSTPEALLPAELAAHRRIETECDGIAWAIEVELSADPAVSDWLYVSDCPSPLAGGTRTLGIRVAMAHPFMEVAAALALAEVTARQAGVPFAGAIRIRVNQLLREALCSP